MSQNKYTQYSGFSKSQEAPATEEPVVTPEVKPEETPVAPTTEEPVVVPEEDVTIGVVIECEKLNVRKEPSSDATVLTTIPLGAEVQVDIDCSTNGFYKVCTGAGIEGYCVEKYINIK